MTTTFIIVILAVLLVVGAFRFIGSKNQETQTTDSPSIQEEDLESARSIIQLEDQKPYVEIHPSSSVEDQVSVEKKAPVKKSVVKKESPSKNPPAKKPGSKTAKKPTAKKPTK